MDWIFSTYTFDYSSITQVNVKMDWIISPYTYDNSGTDSHFGVSPLTRYMIRM